MPTSVLINTRSLITQRTGVGQYTYHIARRIMERSDAFDYVFHHGVTSKTLPEGTDGFIKTGHVEALRQFLLRHPAIKRPIKMGLDLVSHVTALSGPVYDVYFEPNFIPTIHGRFRHTVATVHDFSCAIHPEWHPADRVRAFDKYFRKKAAKCDALVTVSAFVKEQAVSMFGLEADKVVVIPNGVDHAAFRELPPGTADAVLAGRDLPEAFTLFVGTIEPRKNLGTLLAAYEALPEAVKKAFPLLVVGGNGWLNDDLFATMRRMEPYVRYLGYVDTAKLVALLNRATLFVYPSWYEGFGLPALEAMACGCPVVATDRSALPEVCGEAATYVDPADTDGLRRIMEALLGDADRRAVMRERGLTRARDFTWTGTADAHLELFARLAQGR